MKTAAIIVCLLPVLLSQQPRFEVASVKLSGGAQNGMAIGCRGIDSPSSYSSIPLGRCQFPRESLRAVVRYAFSMGMDGVRGGPPWVDEINYSIFAKAEDKPVPTRAQLNSMLQALLEDRFQLKVHRESKVVSGYALVVAKGGLKMKPMKDTDPRIPGGGAAGKGGKITGHQDMRGLVFLLSLELRQPVIDQTGLTETYLIDLRWRPLEGEEGAGNVSDRLDLPTIHEALKPLGLQLEKTKTTVETLVIDSAVKPTPF